MSELFTEGPIFTETEQEIIDTARGKLDDSVDVSDLRLLEMEKIMEGYRQMQRDSIRGTDL